MAEIVSGQILEDFDCTGRKRHISRFAIFGVVKTYETLVKKDVSPAKRERGILAWVNRSCTSG